MAPAARSSYAKHCARSLTAKGDYGPALANAEHALELARSIGLSLHDLQT